jgi:hypothetical protein
MSSGRGSSRFIPDASPTRLVESRLWFEQRRIALQVERPAGLVIDALPDSLPPEPWRSRLRCSSSTRAFVAIGLALSILVIRDTTEHVRTEAAAARSSVRSAGVPSGLDVFWRTTVRDKNLSSVSQAGLVNNLNDGMAWPERF